MRILQLRFKNLNSLAGEWRIDFTHPAYISSGIFAITGPTGSGKTTILDAICLALYGQTPRLKNISKSTNEIMTRNTGECIAEVVFESQAGQFVCHWSQRRAYGKPDGELQQPKHEISEYLSKKVLENKLSRVIEKVIETTGLDYNQFTRSIMLAQGDFAIFLNANPDERAPILEKITGTAIYSEISKKVHERNADEANKRRELKERIGNLDLLPSDKVLEMKRNSQQIEAEVKKISSARDTLRQAVAWLQNISRLELEIADLNDRKRISEEKRSRSTEDLARLARVRKALPLEEAYSKLESARSLAATYEQEIKESNAKLDAGEATYNESLTAFESIRTRLDILRDNLEKEKRVLVQVRALDTRINESDQQITERREELKRLQDKILECQGIISAGEQEREEKMPLLEAAVAYLKGHEVDGRLPEHLSGLEERLAQYSRLIETLDLNRKRLESQKNELSRLNDAFSVQAGLLSKKEKSVEATTAQLLEIQDTYAQMLDYRGPGFWRKCASSLKERRTKLESELKILESVEKIGVKIQDLKEQRKVLEEELERTREILSGLYHEQKLQDEVLAKIEANLEILPRVESFEEEREHLEEGKPCPLCGSLDHPYAEGRIPRLDKAKSEWVIKKGELQGLHEKIRLQEASVLKAEANLHLNEKTEQERRDQIRELLEGSSLEFEDPEFVMESSDLKETIQRALFRCDRHYEWCHDVSESADEMEKALIDAKDVVATAKDNLARQKTECRDVEVERDRCAGTITDLEGQVTTHEGDRERLHQGLLIDLQDFGIDSIDARNIKEIAQSLKQRKKEFEGALNQKGDLEKEVGLLSKDIENNRRQMSDNQKSADSLLQVIEDKEKKKMEISHQRFGIYGTKDPDIEEKKLTENVRSAETEFQTASGTIKEYSTRIASLREQISGTIVKLNEVRGMLEDLESVFRERIRMAGFLSEDDFISARIPHDQFETLEKLEEELLFEERNISSRFEESTRLLDLERSRGVTDKPLDDLEREILTCEETITDLNRSLGSISQMLKDHEQVMALQKDLVQALEKQETECLRWEKLHDLIGSADGKKFRVFAQGITFDRLIAHANTHLRKMSDRYLLVRRENPQPVSSPHLKDRPTSDRNSLTRREYSPLDLDIMDNYQAGQIRSTKNLSGGESFIVSLALALGLSGMASRNVRIDSLFLDEGFGTLDSDTLEIALETLSNLQQEGKIIGIISHVPALKEHISTKIILEKTAGGRSRIIAPGCTSTSVW